MDCCAGTRAGRGRPKVFRMVVGKSRECMERTQAACTPVARVRNMSLEDAVKDVCQVYNYISELTQLP